jgi:hypothetical protein
MFVLACVVAIVYFLVAVAGFIEWATKSDEYGGWFGLVTVQVIWLIMCSAFGGGTLLLYTMMVRGMS